jgi:hypothetical protein
MRVSQVYVSNSDWLKAADLDGPTNVTITEVGTTVWDRQDEKSGRQYKADEITLSFDGFDKKLSLNKTNAARVGQLLGDEADNWIGHTITLYVEQNVKSPQGIGPALRVMPMLPGGGQKRRAQGPGPAPHVAGLVNRQQRQAPPPPQSQDEYGAEYDPLA